MTWKIKDDGKTPKEVYNWKVYLVSIAVGFGGALFGYDNAFLGGTLALPSFQQQFGLVNLSTTDQNNLSSNIVITFQCGCLLACFLSLPCTEMLGRRKALLLASVIFTIGAAIQLTGHIESFYVGRFLTGLGVGPMTSVAPLYISEVAPAPLRGRCIGIFEMMYQLGGLLGFWINYGVSLHVSNTSSTQWRIPVSIQLPLIGVLLLGCLFVPETPRFLMKQDRHEKAKSVLAGLRNLPLDHEYLRQEVSDIHDEIQIERAIMGISSDVSRWGTVKRMVSECLRRDIMYRISVGVVTQFIGQFSGINGINYYSPTIFKSLGVVGTSTGLFATGIYGVVKTVTALVSLGVLVDRVGRRALLLSGCVIMTVSLFFVGGYIKIANPSADQKEITSGGIAACAFIYIYVIGFVSSFAGIPFILSSEVVPLNVRAISAVLGAATQWLGNLVVTKATPYMVSSIGYGTFFFFGSCVVVGSVYVWFFVPETRGVQLEHMALAFGQEDVVGNKSALQDKSQIVGAANIREVETV